MYTPEEIEFLCKAAAAGSRAAMQSLDSEAARIRSADWNRTTTPPSPRRPEHPVLLDQSVNPDHMRLNLVA